MGKKWVYLAQYVGDKPEAQVGALVKNTMEWRAALAENFPIGVIATYVDWAQQGKFDLGPSVVYGQCTQDISNASGMVADVSQEGALYVGVLVEIGYALGIGIPVVVYAPGGVNERIVQRKMLSGCTIVHTKAEAAQVLARKMSSR